MMVLVMVMMMTMINTNPRNLKFGNKKVGVLHSGN
jgi:hypothetical protein